MFNGVVYVREIVIDINSTMHAHFKPTMSLIQPYDKGYVEANL